MDHAFGAISKKLSSYLWSSRFPLMFPSRSFIIFHFPLRFMMHFELIFVKGIKNCLDSFLTCSNIICWKVYVYSIVLLLFFFKNQFIIYVGLFLGSLLGSSIDLISIYIFLSLLWLMIRAYWDRVKQRTHQNILCHFLHCTWIKKRKIAYL